MFSPLTSQWGEHREVSHDLNSRHLTLKHIVLAIMHCSFSNNLSKCWNVSSTPKGKGIQTHQLEQFHPLRWCFPKYNRGWGREIGCTSFQISSIFLILFLITIIITRTTVGFNMVRFPIFSHWFKILIYERFDKPI